MTAKRVTVKILLLLVLSDVLETFTHFCFKKAAVLAQDFSLQGLAEVAPFFRGVFSSPFLWLGLFSVLTVFIIWSTILSRIDLSVAVPIASFSYILVPVVSIAFLHERISLLRWSGIIFILLGVIFVSWSTKEEGQAHL